MPKPLKASLLAAALCWSMAAVAQPSALPEGSAAAAGFSAGRLQRVHEFLAQSTDARGYLGGVTLVARNGRIIDWQAHGYSDLGRSHPMQRDSIFRIYSMTKTVTSVAALMLVEEGKLTLDEPIGRVLPQLADMQVLEVGSNGAQRRAAARPITLRHLLTHTAGFPAGLPGDAPALAQLQASNPEGAPDLRGFVERLGKAPLAADPGTRFAYDGTGTQVVARMVEAVSGQAFEQFLERRIFQPLAMHDTGFSVANEKRKRVVDITRMGKDGRLVLDDGPSAVQPGARLNAYASGAGGLYSTAGDYARFCQMLLNQGALDGATVLGRKTVELMFLNHLGMLAKPVNQYSDGEGFGLGGYVVTDVAKRGTPGSLGQFGWSGAASTNFMIDPSEHLVAILMLQHLPNDTPGDLPRIGRKFQTLVLQALVP